MVRPGLRRSEIDWENVDIHVSREEMEREQEHETAIQQAKQYLIKNFPKFCTINNGYYETETFDHDAGMYEVMHVDHIVIGDQAIYVIQDSEVSGECRIIRKLRRKKLVLCREHR